MSKCIIQVQYSGEPVEVEYFGNRIHVLGFTEDADLIFRVEPAAEPITIGFINERLTPGSWTVGGAIQAQIVRQQAGNSRRCEG